MKEQKDKIFSAKIVVWEAWRSGIYLVKSPLIKDQY